MVIWDWDGVYPDYDILANISYVSAMSRLESLGVGRTRIPLLRPSKHVCKAPTEAHSAIRSVD